MKWVRIEGAKVLFVEPWNLRTLAVGHPGEKVKAWRKESGLRLVVVKVSRARGTTKALRRIVVDEACRSCNAASLAEAALRGRCG